MNRFVLFAAAIALFATSFTIPTMVNGQTVFLPVFRNFSYRGVVSVPDGGTIKMGGVSSSSEGATTLGVPGLSNIPGISRGFKNRGIGRDQESGTMTATVKVLIMEELEAEHLAKAGYVPGQQAENADVIRQAAFLSQHVGRNVSATQQSPPRDDSRRNRRR